MKDSDEKNNILCIRNGTIFFPDLDFHIVSTNLQSFGYFSSTSYTSSEFFNIFRLEFIFLDITDILDVD